MKKIDLSQAVGLLANICVVVGIVLLVVELRFTREALYSATYQARANSLEDFQQFMAESEYQLPALMRYRSESWDALDPIDQARMRSAALGIFYRLDNLHRQYELGVLDQEYCDAVFRPDMESWVPRWKDMGLLDDRTMRSARPSFAAEIQRYADAELVK